MEGQTTWSCVVRKLLIQTILHKDYKFHEQVDITARGKKLNLTNDVDDRPPQAEPKMMEPLLITVVPYFATSYC
jgi:hypothetical protein